MIKVSVGLRELFWVGGNIIWMLDKNHVKGYRLDMDDYIASY